MSVNWPPPLSLRSSGMRHVITVVGWAVVQVKPHEETTWFPGLSQVTRTTMPWTCKISFPKEHKLHMLFPDEGRSQVVQVRL